MGNTITNWTTFPITLDTTMGKYNISAFGTKTIPNGVTIMSICLDIIQSGTPTCITSYPQNVLARGPNPIIAEQQYLYLFVYNFNGTVTKIFDASNPSPVTLNGGIFLLQATGT